jgi:hypothetical protein
MASRTKPLISAAALASAAAIAVATPALSPNLGAPTPAALSKAAFQLTTLSDVLSIPPVVWTDLLFGNESWGGTLGTETYGPAWAAPTDALGQPGYVNPWVVYCDNGCDKSGIPGVSYLFLDALINGNGNGFEDSENWPISFVNYFAEPNGFFPIGSGGGSSPSFNYENLGYSAATWYVLQGTLGQAVPELTVPIAALFWGPTNLTVAYNLALSTAAALLQAVPLVGPFAGDSILAYLGDLPVDPANPSLGFYQYGLSGALNYWIDIATGAVPFPTGATPPAPLAASLVADAAVVEADTAKVASVEVAESALAVDAPSTSPVVEAPAVGEPTVEVADEAPVVEVTDEAPVVEVTDEAQVVEVTDEAPAVEIEDVVTEVETKPAVAPEAPAVTEDDLDSDVADLDLADLDAADSAPADAPKGSVDDAADSDSKPAAESPKADTDSAGDSDSSGAGDSAGSDKSDSDSDS